ncbi:MAG: FtsW/RodA/SpoVE family cell cycle protein [Prevotella sp.]|nr:FtsW/RodA/SpoVE family cell cycle protein [Prevotella sp.]
MNKKKINIFKGDKVVWMVFFFLCMISLVEVFSASSNLTYKSQNYMKPILFHAGTVFAGLVVAVLTLNIPCKYFKVLTLPMIFVSVVTLLWVLIGGDTINGANRVISLGFFTFQPSEIAKGTIVLCTAQILSAMQREDGADPMAFKYILFVSVPMVFLIMLENLSTAALLAMVVILMMFIGRVPMRQMGKLMAVLGGILVVGLTFIMLAGGDPAQEEKLSATNRIEQTQKDKSKIDKLFHRATTWKGRISKFMVSKDTPVDSVDLDKDMQEVHASIAIVSSNIIGKGPGNSVERDYLPQAFSDFIYAIIIEEMGIVGAAFVVFLYIILLYRAARIASQCENNFPAMLVMGLVLLLVVQAVFNMLVAVGLVPVTGQPLPLISKGGTSTIVNGAYIGAILSVSRWAKKKKDKGVKPATVAA